MPVLTRILDHIRPQADGTIKARERLTHSRGVIYHNIRAADKAAAVATMNARDLTEQLRDEERIEVIDFVRDGSGTPNDFVHNDLTVPGKRRAVLRHFATTRFADDDAFHTNVAAWVSGLTVGAIERLLTVSTDRAAAIRDRATNRVAVVGLNTLLSADDAAVDEDVD